LITTNQKDSQQWIIGSNFCPNKIPEYAKSFFIIASVYFVNSELSIHEPCIGYTIFGDKSSSLLVVFLTGFSLANIPAYL
jgi:hypothetical protein